MKLSKKIVMSVLGGSLMLSLLSIGGCGLDTEKGPSQEKIFDSIVEILQTVKNGDDECGIFNTKDITDGSTHQKSDTTGGGSYKREKKSIGDSKSSMEYEFKNYTGNVTPADGTVLKLNGTLTGTQEEAGKDSMSVSGTISIYSGENQLSNMIFNTIKIDNGTDDSNCGKIESLVSSDDSSDGSGNSITLTSVANSSNKFALKVANSSSNEKEKALWVKLLKFEDSKKVSAPSK